MILGYILKSLFITTNRVPTPIRWFLKCLDTSVKTYFSDEIGQSEKEGFWKILGELIYEKWLWVPLFAIPTCYFKANSYVFEDDSTQGKQWISSL